MSTLRDFPSYRLRHRVRLWLYRRRREAWHRRQARADRRPAVRPTKRYAFAAILLIGIVLSLLATLSVMLTLRASGHLERGRSALIEARNEIATGSAQAVSNFEAARSQFQAAKARMDNVFVSIAASIPLVGRTPDAIRTAAEAGLLVTDAGQTLTSAVRRLRGGLESLSLSGKQIPVEALGKFQPAVEDALSKVEDAQWLADNVATTFVPAAIVEAGDQLRSMLQRTVSALRSTNAILTALPAFAGMEDGQRYFLAPQDPSILRGTGGAFSYWAILRIQRGRIFLQPFHYIDELPIPDRAEWPSEALEDAYGSVDAAGDWDFANAPTDGPTAAGFISRLWEQTGNKPIDGVIMIDPLALGSLLEATGPVQVDGVPFSLTSTNVVPFLTNGAYLLPGDVDVRRGYLGLAGLRIFRDFLSEARGYAAVKALVDAAAGGHLLMNVTDPAVQSDLRIAGITGAIDPAPGNDLFALGTNNLAGNRVDYYIRRTIDYDVTLEPDGRGRATATVTLENDSPLEPSARELNTLLLPREGPSDLEPGEAYEQASFTCGRGCRLLGSSVDGEDLPMSAHAFAGLRTFTGTLRIPPQESRTLTMTFDLGFVWHGDGAQGTYALSIPTRPLIRGTAGTVTIHAPGGMTIAAMSPDMTAEGSSAMWGDSMSEPLTLRIRFERSSLGRIWWGLTNAF